MRFTSILAPAASALLLSVATGAQEPPVFAPADVFELEYVSDPRIAPDGESVVYVRNSMDIMTDRRKASLWHVALDGSAPRPLTDGIDAASMPRWSPDGKRLAFVSSASGSAQLHVLWLDTGQTTKLTQLRRSPGSLTWSPDGDWLAFTMFVPEASEPFVKPPKKPKGAEWAPAPTVITEVHYRSDGRGYLEQGHSHQFVVPSLGGTPRQVTSGSFNHGGTPSFTPDGSALVVSANRHEGWQLNRSDTEVYRIPLDGGDPVALTDRRGPDEGATMSPDGSWIAYTGFDDRLQGYQVRQLYVMKADGSESRSLTGDLDRSVSSPRWIGNERIAFAYDDHGDRKLASIDLDGERKALAEGLGGLSLGRPYTSGGFTIAAGGRYAFTHGRADRPSDLAVGEAGAAPRVLTSVNEDLLGYRALGEVESLTVPSSHDGRPIQGWILTPPGFDPEATYPLILEIHGGPFSAYGPHFTAECQLYAAAGYVVLYVNPRGSTSYGEEFGNLIHHAYPSQDYDDLMSTVDAVLERGYVDPERLFVTGGSGGGVLTAWIVGKTNRFAAAVVAKPVINWTSFALTADAYDFFYKYWFAAPPWETPDAYWKRSPLSLVGNVETPTMLLTGEEDYRTPITESEQLYQALQLREIDTALVRIPGASHGIAARPSHLIAKVQHILAWFERYDASEDSDGSEADGTR